MNWDAIAAVAEVAGAIGVIVTLLYLALQVRQNNALMQSEASIAYAEMRRGSYRALSEDTTLLSTILKAANGEELTPVEALSLEFFNRSVFVNWEWEYQQYEEGVLRVLDQAPAARWRPVVNATPRMRETWSKYRESMSPHFVQYLEDEVLNWSRPTGS